MNSRQYKLYISGVIDYERYEQYEFKREQEQRR